jgi:flagellar hook-basal body complex protein FliE
MGAGVGGVGGVGGVTGAGSLQQLAEAYRRQVAGQGGTEQTAGAGSVPGGAQGASAAGRSADFAGAVTNSLGQLEQLDRTSAGKAVQAATGSLSDVQDYVIAATQAQLATQLTTTVRNKALDAFNEIMRMPL